MLNNQQRRCGRTSLGAGDADADADADKDDNCLSFLLKNNSIEKCRIKLQMKHIGVITKLYSHILL
jgi:hypothetical protein